MKTRRAFLTFSFLVWSFYVQDVRWLEWMAWGSATFIWISGLGYFIVLSRKDGDEDKEKVLQRYRDGFHLPLAVDLVFYFALLSLLFDSGWYFTFGVTISSAISDFALRQQSTDKPQGEDQ